MLWRISGLVAVQQMGPYVVEHEQDGMATLREYNFAGFDYRAHNFVCYVQRSC